MKLQKNTLGNENSLPMIEEAIQFAPKKLVVGAWTGHMPFAFWIVSILHPKVIVELGTYSGDSYFALCQAVIENKLDTECYAVDTWKGDEHTGFYSPKIFNDFLTYHDKFYTSFSHLLRMTFDEAVSIFNDGDIDLLHIDGLHTYEAVKHDFETWKPKLSGCCVVLFHDINVRQKGFGVWKFWEDIKKLHPYLEFYHSHGLGVLFVGNNFSSQKIAIINQFDTFQKQGLICHLFASLGQIIHNNYKIVSLSQAVNERDSQIANLNKAVTERDTQITNLNKAVTERDTQITNLNQAVTERDTQITNLNQAVTERDAAKTELELMISSTSWQITKPVRMLSSNFKRMRFFFVSGFCRFAINRAASWFRYNRRLPALRELWNLAKKARWKYRTQFKMNLGSTDFLANLKTKLEMAPGVNPLISVIMPVYKTPIDLLKCAVKSLHSQIYQNWELCICDDGSSDSILSSELLSLAQSDNRIKIISLDSNSGISNATNICIAKASGDFIAFLDHDDELTPDALGEIVLAIRSNPSADILYSDQDKIDEAGTIIEQFHKPDWSPDYFRGVMYVGHLLVVRNHLLQKVGKFDSHFDGVQDYEFMLRASEQTSNIVHIPKILYHWRALKGSIASYSNAKGKLEKIQCEAVQKHLYRLGLDREVVPHPIFPHRAKIGPLKCQPHDKVSIIIPTKDQPRYISRCLDSIFKKTEYKNFEVLIIDNGTTDKEALKILQQYPVQVIPYLEPFNYSKANNIGVNNSSGDVVVLLNNDIEVVTEDWLEILLGNLNQDDVGVVGPLLMYPNKTVQHAGIVLGARGTVDHLMRGFPIDSDGYAGSLSCTREVSSVTGACLMTRKDLYLELGGLVEFYGTHYQDADFCLKIREAGFRILHVPDARLIHFESATRGTEYDFLDRLLFQDSWVNQLAKGDPYFNPALSLEKLDYSIDNSW